MFSSLFFFYIHLFPLFQYLLVIKAVLDYHNSLESWDTFVKELKVKYKLDYGLLRDEFDAENLNYYVYTAHWKIIDPAIIVSDAPAIYSIDLKTVTLDEVLAVNEKNFNLQALQLQRLANGTTVRRSKLQKIPIAGIAAWFDVKFNGGVTKSTMSTGPENGYTHWGQYALYFLKSLIWDNPDANELSGTFAMHRTPANPRMYDIHLTMNGGKRAIYNLP